MEYTQSSSSPKDILNLFYKIENDKLAELDKASSGITSEEGHVLSNVYCEDILQHLVK